MKHDTLFRLCLFFAYRMFVIETALDTIRTMDALQDKYEAKHRSRAHT